MLTKIQKEKKTFDHDDEHKNEKSVNTAIINMKKKLPSKFQ
jgi:hypothetical protein